MSKSSKRQKLVPGKVPGPISEIGLIVVNSVFYDGASGLEQTNNEKDEQRHTEIFKTPVQETGSQDFVDIIESSVTSKDVQISEMETAQPSTESTQIHRSKPFRQSRHKPIAARSSYVPVKSKNVKILVVGDKGAGKTSLIEHATSDQESSSFCCHYKSTNSPNCRGKLLEHYGELYIIHFWEPIDEPHLLETQHCECYSGAMAAFVVCELSKINRSSIIQQKKKINNTVCKKNGDPIPVYLVASKCDIKGSQNDSFMDKLAEDNGFAGYLRTSAKTGEGIEEAVRVALKEILRETFPNPPEVCETPDDLKI